MINVQFVCNLCSIRHSLYVTDVAHTIGEYMPDDWRVLDAHVPTCPDCMRKYEQ